MRREEGGGWGGEVVSEDRGGRRGHCLCVTCHGSRLWSACHPLTLDSCCHSLLFLSLLPSLSLSHSHIHPHHHSHSTLAHTHSPSPSLTHSLSLNQVHCSFTAKFEEALSGNFTEPKDYMRVWLVYCEYLQRRVSDWSQKDSPDIRELMDTFKKARDDLKECKCV